MNFYLAHPFDARDEVRTWQGSIDSYEHDFVNPFYDLSRGDIAVIDAKGYTRQDMEQGVYPLESKLIVERDVKAIKEADAVVAYLPEMKTIGTHMEIVYGRMFKKAVFIVTPHQQSHPWLKYHATALFDSLDQFKICLEADEL
jgi:nucleoside 2-deoxyribosyltransferase